MAKRGSFGQGNTSRGVIAGVCLALGGIILAGPAAPAQAAALNGKLKGSYYVTESTSCVQSPGFTPEFARTAAGTSFTMNIQSTWTFDGVGGVSIAGTALALSHSSGSEQAGSIPLMNVTYTGTGTYEVNPDLTFSVQFDTTVTEKLAGGDPYPLSVQGYACEGYIGPRGNTLSMVNTTPSLYTVLFSNNTTQYRVCSGVKQAMKKNP